jgi:hypothetical protein
MEVETVISDTAYSGRNNLEKAAQEKIELVSKLNPSFIRINARSDGYFCSKPQENT